MVAVPPHLRDYQREAIEKMHNGCVLAGGVGTGKSIVSIAYFLSKVCASKHGRNAYGDTWQPFEGAPDLYIITTAKKRDSGEWESELQRYALSIGPNTSMGGIHVSIDSWNNIRKYADVRDAFFIFDEQHVVGWGAWSKDFVKIARSNRWILLSATPGDTWSDYIPLFIANGFYKNKTQFMNRHAVYSRWTKYPSVEKWIDEGRLIKLRDHILIPMEASKENDKRVREVYVAYDKDEYKRLLKERWNKEENRPIENFSELAIALRRLVNTHPDRLAETARICETHRRVIIFYNLNAELDQLRKLEKMTCIPVSEWNGQKHDPLPTGDSWIYLVQYTAGNDGWNCITSNTIVFYSLNYSYKVMLQASGRIDRMNTPYDLLNYYVLRSYAPIDLGILRALKGKKQFNAVAFLKRGSK